MFSLHGLFSIPSDIAKKKDEFNLENIESTSKQTNSIINSRSPQAVILNDSHLVANWRFNEGSGASASDSAGYDHVGTVNSDGWLPSYQAQGIDFEKVDADYIDIPDNDSFSFTDGNDLPFSLCAWINIESFGGGADYVIVSKYDSTGAFREYTFFIDDDKLTIVCSHANDFGQRIGRYYNTALSTGVWYFVVATYDGTELEGGLDLYINATNVDDQSQSAGAYTGMTNTNSKLAIGAQGNPSNYFDGFIDEVRLYNKTLSQAEVSELYNYTIASIESETIGLNNYNFTASFEGSLSGEQMNYSLHVRANDTEIASSDTTSNASGVSFFNHAAAIESLEYTLRITNVHYIDEFYFQPRQINYFDYATDQLSDAWDFSENDVEGFILDPVKGELTAADGLANYTVTIEHDDGASMEIAGLSIDASYYNTVSVRLYGSVTFDSAALDIYDKEGGTSLTGNDIISIYDQNLKWFVYTFNLDTGWSGIETELAIKFICITYPIGDYFLIDYIYLYHEDIPTLEQALPSEWWLTSQNDSFSYTVARQNTNTIFIDDLEVQELEIGKGVYFTINAYIDSNFPSSVLIPYEFYETPIIEKMIPNENLRDLFNLIGTISMFILGLLVGVGMLIRIWKILT
jgi:hypothetical protein